MALLDVLQQIIGSATAPDPKQIDAVTREASRDELKSGVGEALRSKETPQLAQIVADMFEKASPEQRAAILNTLTEKLGPGALPTRMLRKLISPIVLGRRSVIEPSLLITACELAAS